LRLEGLGGGVELWVVIPISAWLTSFCVHSLLEWNDFAAIENKAISAQSNKKQLNSNLEQVVAC
jgi:hypothetical protein